MFVLYIDPFSFTYNSIIIWSRKPRRDRCDPSRHELRSKSQQISTFTRMVRSGKRRSGTVLCRRDHRSHERFHEFTSPLWIREPFRDPTSPPFGYLHRYEKKAFFQVRRKRQRIHTIASPEVRNATIATAAPSANRRGLCMLRKRFMHRKTVSALRPQRIAGGIHARVSEKYADDGGRAAIFVMASNSAFWISVHVARLPHVRLQLRQSRFCSRNTGIAREGSTRDCEALRSKRIRNDRRFGSAGTRGAEGKVHNVHPFPDHRSILRVAHQQLQTVPIIR
jgi:hypothetical protein